MKVDVDKLLQDKDFKRDLKRAVKNMLTEYRHDATPARLYTLGSQLREEVHPEILGISDDTEALGELMFQAVASAVVKQLIPYQARNAFYHDANEAD